jgi:hypothetical protein
MAAGQKSDLHTCPYWGALTGYRELRRPDMHTGWPSYFPNGDPFCFPPLCTSTRYHTGTVRLSVGTITGTRTSGIEPVPLLPAILHHLRVMEPTFCRGDGRRSFARGMWHVPTHVARRPTMNDSNLSFSHCNRDHTVQRSQFERSVALAQRNRMCCATANHIHCPMLIPDSVSKLKPQLTRTTSSLPPGKRM